MSRKIAVIKHAQFRHGIECTRHMKIWTFMKIQIAGAIPKLSSLFTPYTDKPIAPSDYAATEDDNEDPN